MSDITIRTNHQPRFLLNWFELTDKERAEFDWLDTDEKRSEAQFFRYRKWTYCLSDFMRCNTPDGPAEFKSWHGYHGDSYFSGILVKYVGDEQIIAATYLS